MWVNSHRSYGSPSDGKMEAIKAMFNTVPKAVYDKMWTILDTTTPTFDFFRTKQRAYYPRAENLINPAFYPWAFIDASGYDPIERLRSPRVWKYEFTVPLVVMTFAVQGDIESLVFASGESDTLGILDIAGIVGEEFWKRRGGFGVTGVRDWTIGRVGIPTVLNVQRHLMNPYVRGVQMDFIFQVNERDVITS
jgi:hypothetical protein